jgi:hypoxanthine phosphoribosyltransferase
MKLSTNNADISIGNTDAEQLEQMISERRIRARTAVLARRIEDDYRGKALSLVVVLKGAVIFAADLMRHITIPFTIDFIAAASYGEGTRSSGNVALSGADGLAIRGRHVLVVEDILDTGRTVAAVLESLQARGPASLALCALLRKPAAAALDLPVAYSGFDIPQDFVVGWGMDHAERYRNLRGVYRLILDGDG